MKIQAISSFAHKGEHVEAGAEIEVADIDAKLLIGLGRAKRLPDRNQASTTIETAEAKPAVETAEAPHAKKKR